MARNASGTYALPAGNPVVTGTTIQSTWANTTLSDIATEMTDSLDRSGKGGMLAALLHTDGTVAAPSLSFNNETNSGFYRAAAGDVRLSVIGTDIMKANAGLVSVLGANGLAVTNGATVGGTLGVTGLATLTGGATVGSSGSGTVSAAIFSAALTANQTVTLRGNRTAADTGTDIFMTSLASRTAGLLLDVQNNGATVMNIANGATVANSTLQLAANFLSFTGTQGTVTASASGATLFLRANNPGAGAGTDVIVTSMTTRTAGLLFEVQNNNVSKLQVSPDGYLLLKGATPAGTTAFTSTLTPKNIVKAWANFSVSAAGVVTINDSFNVTSITVSTNVATVNLASAQNNTSGIVIGQTQSFAPSAVNLFTQGTMSTVSTATLSLYTNGGAAQNWGAGGSTIMVGQFLLIAA